MGSRSFPFARRTRRTVRLDMSVNEEFGRESSWRWTSIQSSCLSSFSLSIPVLVPGLYITMVEPIDLTGKLATAVVGVAAATGNL